MDKAVYRELATRLNEIPNGFPSTESGVELRLLAKIFAPEEALLASVMSMRADPAEEIAARAGVDPREARRTLKEMVRRDLVSAKRVGRKLGYFLIPWVVGIFEGQLARLDVEMATLFEEYYQETQGAMTNTEPALHRVIPVGEAVPVDITVAPYERIAEMVNSAKSWAVQDCICRVQQRLIGKGCDHELENCMTLAPVENYFADDGIRRPITREEALCILHECEEAGLVHSVDNRQDSNTYICNCCSCCCGLLRGMVDREAPGAIASSRFVATVDEDACVGCGVCIDRCPLGALDLSDEGVSTVTRMRCIGCGLCAITCPTDALTLQERPAHEVTEIPEDHHAWLVRRAQFRGQSLDGIE